MELQAGLSMQNVIKSHTGWYKVTAGKAGRLNLSMPFAPYSYAGFGQQKVELKSPVYFLYRGFTLRAFRLLLFMSGVRYFFVSCFFIPILRSKICEYSAGLLFSKRYFLHCQYAGYCRSLQGRNSIFHLEVFY